MLINILQLLSPIIGLAVNVVFGLLCLRCIKSIGLLKAETLASCLGLLCVMIIELYRGLSKDIAFSDFLAIFAVNILTYSALAYCYFNFVNLGETARRIRILRELYESGDGLTEEELLARYDAKEIISRRIDRLILSKQIVYKQDRYYIASPFLLAIAKLIVVMKLVIMGKRSEFD